MSVGQKQSHLRTDFTAQFYSFTKSSLLGNIEKMKEPNEHQIPKCSLI